MLVSCNLSLCVKQCQLVYLLDGSEIRNLANINRFRKRRGVLKTWSCHTFSESYHSVMFKVSARQVHRKNNAYCADESHGHWNTVSQAMGCYYQYSPCQEARVSLTEEEIWRGFRKRELNELLKQYIQAKGYNVNDMYECDRWKMYTQHLRESCPNKMPLREEKLLENIKSGSLFG